ncbi:branched-chain amino acid ABC transporter permease [Bradyrhizobium sp. LHD-71]|uniref:branched-chain amino acid ABC transporter permease n=1 Tax=Bradyrhizobium sp. LHD-71 TaxID=3072141 RepID=UPI0028103299|nr:branched-chain amino acid ABC transporter permease [Bradyrhizobium sp. LHD-71]MDQ8732016.1 branched-chain amino acid ABC transporter permease [Bradyrhizobium sp. LHD-71]
MSGKAAGSVLLAALLAVPFVVQSEFWLSFWLLVLMFAFLGQSWNVLGGYGGQFSFGHALFFGGGAFGTAILQVRHGINAYLAGAIAITLTAMVGALLGYLVFRYRLRGAYFALVTLAFAEVARVLIASFEYTGGGFGMLVPLARGAANFQFDDRRIFYLIAWTLVAGGCLIALWLENSRFGAQLIAVRENEDGAQALGVDPVRTKVLAIALSAAMAATVGVFYVQNFLFVDSQIAFGPGMSIEALLVAIIGGVGTAFGPLIGAVVLHALGELAKQITGNAPGLNLVLYGLLLIAALRFLPSGFVSAFGRRPKASPGAVDA